MRAVVQRVDRATVAVDDEVVGSIGIGLAVLVGTTHDDSTDDAAALATKLVGLRVFADGDGRFNLSLQDVGGEVLIVSQFTLYGEVRRGRRPSFTAAADPESAASLIDHFADLVRAEGVSVSTGRFGAMMNVDLRNNGPFTLVIETKDGRIL